MNQSATTVSRTGTVRVLTGLRLPRKLLERVDAYCFAQPLQPSRTKVIELAILEFLEREEPLLPARKSA